MEETIRSVLLQGYPDLEYIIMDGGSTDGSVEIIRKYDPWLAYWTAEQDDGQVSAINQGLKRCTGDVLAWINSDDFYLPSAFGVAAIAMRPKSIVLGNSVYLRPGEAHYVFSPLFPRRFTRFPGTIPQHSTFWSSDIPHRLDESFTCAFDYEFWYRLSRTPISFRRVSQALAAVNMHDSQKSIAAAWANKRSEDDSTLKRKYPELKTPPSRISGRMLWAAQVVARCIARSRETKIAFSAFPADLYRIWPALPGLNIFPE
jgi:glycosyltransferase involved in cell wall biosynthesis